MGRVHTTDSMSAFVVHYPTSIRSAFCVRLLAGSRPAGCLRPPKHGADMAGLNLGHQRGLDTFTTTSSHFPVLCQPCSQTRHTFFEATDSRILTMASSRSGASIFNGTCQQ